MSEEDPSLSWIVDTVGSIDELADLQQGGPHSALASSNGGLSFTVVEELMHNHSSSKTQ
jgi:hypothetical protein